MSVHSPGRFLSITIDTEEEGLWSGQYSAKATVDNIQSVPRFQALCDRFAIRPTYLITTPVAESAEAVSVLRSIQDSGRCEIGTHVHPWNSPPLAGESSESTNSFLCKLSFDTQHQKIEKLTEQIETSFGIRPISFRAGRYGVGGETLRSLRSLGYRVDSSVLPMADYRSQGGPDFRTASCRPYFPSQHDFLSRGQDEGLLEVPVTAGFTHRFFRTADYLRGLALKSPMRQLRAVGILDRLGIARKVKLSPEQASLENMKALASSVIAQGIEVLVLMFHSSSLLPGCSPYVTTADDLERFLNRLEQFFIFAREQLALNSILLGDCYQYQHQLTTSLHSGLLTPQNRS